MEKLETGNLPSRSEMDAKMAKLSDFLADKGKVSVTIPMGGSNHISLWGYVECWNEMMEQKYFDEITDVVLVCGSGGTGLDLALANHWSGSGKGIHAVCILGSAEAFYHH